MSRKLFCVDPHAFEGITAMDRLVLYSPSRSTMQMPFGSQHEAEKEKHPRFIHHAIGNHSVHIRSAQWDLGKKRRAVRNGQMERGKNAAPFGIFHFPLKTNLLGQH
ncbi:MAG: hypothetical protein IJ244_04260 [Bacteroidaceae bacterium]|nr:hypothetical protein [Bacteroidaceae bacterium]